MLLGTLTDRMGMEPILPFTIQTHSSRQSARHHWQNVKPLTVTASVRINRPFLMEMRLYVVVNSLRGPCGILTCSAGEWLYCVDATMGRRIPLSDGQSCKPPRHIQIGIPAIASNLQVFFWSQPLYLFKVLLVNQCC